MNFFNFMIMIPHVYLCVLKERDHTSENQMLKRKFPIDNTKPSLINTNKKVNQEMTYFLFEDPNSDQPKEKKHRDDLENTNLENEKDYLLNIQNNMQQNEEKILEVRLNHNRIFNKNEFLYKTRLHIKIVEFLNDKITYKGLRECYLIKMLEILSNYENLIISKTTYLRYKTSIFEVLAFIPIRILNNILKEFRKDTKFNLEQYNKFNVLLLDQLNSIEDMEEFRRRLKTLSIEVKQFLYYTVLTPLSKYFREIPELMILDGIFSEINIDLQLISIYFINLLLEEKEAKDVKVFVLFLIKKVLKLSNRHNLDLFDEYKFKIICPVVENNLVHFFNLNFILYEMDPSKRSDIKRKVKKYNKWTGFTKIDQIHIRSAIIVSLYQQMIFLEYNNAKKEEIENYISLVEKVIDEEYGCTGCEVYRFFKILKHFF